MTQKPRAEPGTYCPFWHKDVSKVCHTCEMWEPLRVGKKLVSGAIIDETDHWACTLKHLTFVMRDNLRAVEGLQAAEESFRNTAWKETQANLHDIVETVKHQNGFNADVVLRMSDGFAAIARVLGATRLPPGDDQKLLG